MKMNMLIIMIVLLFLFYGTSFSIQENTETLIVKASKYAFKPSLIEVCTNKKYVLKIVSVDVKHGFKIKKLKIHVELRPHKEVTVPLYIHEPGTYFFSCSVYCGRGHKKMIGRVIARSCSKEQEGTS